MPQHRTVIFTQNLGGNLHEAAKWLNDNKLGLYLVTLQAVSPTSTIAVLRLHERHWLVREHEEHMRQLADRHAERAIEDPKLVKPGLTSLLRQPLRPGDGPQYCYCPPDRCEAPAPFRGPCNRHPTEAKK